MAATAFSPVLQVDENTGASDVLIDPSNPDVVYCHTLGSARRTVGKRFVEWPSTAGIYKSTDGGQNFEKLAGGLPKEIIQAHVAIAESNPKRLIASSGVQASQRSALSFRRCRRKLAANHHGPASCGQNRGR